MEQLLNLEDFERAASTRIPSDAWGYIASGAEDELTLKANRSAFKMLWLRPRVMVDVRGVSTKCSILGVESSLPVFISATAMNGLAHPEGEVAVTRAAHQAGIIQMIPTISCKTSRSGASISFRQCRKHDKMYVSGYEGCSRLTVDRPTAHPRPLREPDLAK